MSSLCTYVEIARKAILLDGASSTPMLCNHFADLIGCVVLHRVVFFCANAFNGQPHTNPQSGWKVGLVKLAWRRGDEQISGGNCTSAPNREHSAESGECTIHTRDTLNKGALSLEDFRGVCAVIWTTLLWLAVISKRSSRRWMTFSNSARRPAGSWWYISWFSPIHLQWHWYVLCPGIRICCFCTRTLWD